jgi:hypothetical protein
MIETDRDFVRDFAAANLVVRIRGVAICRSRPAGKTGGRIDLCRVRLTLFITKPASSAAREKVDGGADPHANPQRQSILAILDNDCSRVQCQGQPLKSPAEGRHR